MVFVKFNRTNFDNMFSTCIILFIVVLILCVYSSVSFKQTIENDPPNPIIKNTITEDKYRSLVNIIGVPTYHELDSYKNLKSATWMSPLDNFSEFGKYGGCDYIKIHGVRSKKYLPYPANVFLIIGKYVDVPEHLLGPLKYASETINIEQLFIPKVYSDKYYNTGKKDVALVTGSCASVTISAITVQFAMDMIEKHRDNKKSLELYDEFRYEYDRRIHDYLCGKGITDHIEWYDHNFFEESDKAYVGEKCINSRFDNKKQGMDGMKEHFTHDKMCEGMKKSDKTCKFLGDTEPEWIAYKKCC